MRQFGQAFADHIAGGQTTLATCWRIERSDGVVLGFTDHDRILSFDGTDYVPAHGLDASEVSAKSGPQVDTSEVLGVLHSEAITEDDIVLGRFGGAEVQSWRVNWADVSQRALLRTDSIGEIVREDGVFRAELRSGQQALNVTKGRVYQALCDAQLGDKRCGVDLEQAHLRALGTVIDSGDAFHLDVTGLAAFEAGWFGFGHVVWTSGQRLGLRDRVVSHQRIGGQDRLGFDTAVGEWAVAGDTLTVYAGCDRRLASCAGKFGNVVNFRGFPHIPGNDFILRHPRQGDALDGRPVIR